MLGHAAVDGEVEGEEEADDDIEDEADAGGHLVIQQRHKAGQGHFIVEMVTNIRKLCVLYVGDHISSLLTVGSFSKVQSIFDI